MIFYIEQHGGERNHQRVYRVDHDHREWRRLSAAMVNTIIFHNDTVFVDDDTLSNDISSESHFLKFQISIVS